MSKKTPKKAVVAGDGINVETRKLHRSLIAQMEALSARINDTDNPDDLDKLLREIHEMNFRVMIVGSLLFKQTTDAIDADIGGVVAASDELKASLQQLTRINDIVVATTKFLGLVDKVLDVIKLL